MINDKSVNLIHFQQLIEGINLYIYIYIYTYISRFPQFVISIYNIADVLTTLSMTYYCLK